MALLSSGSFFIISGMKWIHNYQLFLFDFDGVLVNTEELHYKAYQQMCAGRGFTMDWDWPTYARAAMYDASGLEKAFYAAFPELQKQEPNWEVLYQEKKQAYAHLLRRGEVQLMPGVEPLLLALQEAGIKRCVVTHSAREQISIIRRYQPLLNTIPAWVTREDYSEPKPHPECYQKAISLYKAPEDKVIGFEDSPRGLKALLGTESRGILVSSLFKPEELQTIVKKPFTMIPSFESLCYR